MVAELTPAALDEGSLPAVIGRQCERLSAETGVAVTMRSDDELPALGMATDVVLVRAAQEAFANVRDVQASTGSVEQSSVAGRVRLSVADNGIGRCRWARGRIRVGWHARTYHTDWRHDVGDATPAGDDGDGRDHDLTTVCLVDDHRWSARGCAG